MAETCARYLADYILCCAHERGLEVTNLKLQKLLYYCQAWHLAILDKPLFSERLEAWVHGPVVPPVFGAFKEHRWNQIPVVDSEPRIETGDSRWPIDRHVAEVLDAYGDFTGPQLEALTHREAPWRIARAETPADQPSSAVISHQSMIDFFRPQVVEPII